MKTASRLIVFAIAACGLGFVVASCDGGRAECSPGLEGCLCTPDGLCLTGLDCVGGVCARQGGGADAGPGGTDAGPGSCSGCAPGQACTGGACIDPPAECPCPTETYCDLAMGRCVLGCTSDVECDPSRSRICDAAARTCQDGCREDAGCPPGQICDGSACRPGCRSTMDCASGQICDGSTCRTGCESDTGCTAPGEVCDAASQTCRAGCRSSATCPIGEICGGASVCVPGCDGPSRCPAGLDCVGGVCACTPGLTSCGGTCADTSTSMDHCGGCDRPCAGSLATCEGGVCNETRPSSGFWSACTVNEDCPETSLLCLPFGSPVVSGYCTTTCGAGDDTSTCAPVPSGTAGLACVSAGPRRWCALDCSGGRTCPPTMVCGRLSDGSEFCR